ncbi:SAM-dependent methyltransferase [Pelomyxa schiedti]|nr:SAM-dependent methyltransferase [Pelomyxa schiedti]
MGLLVSLTPMLGEQGFTLAQRMMEHANMADDSSMEGKPENMTPGQWAFLEMVSGRTIFFDHHLLELAKNDGVSQIVILASGMDTRAYRLDWPSGVSVFELDFPDVLSYKDRIIISAGGSPRCTRKALGLDLSQNTWIGSLKSIGFDTSKPCAILMEGLLGYLDPESVETLMQNVRSLCEGNPLSSILLNLGSWKLHDTAKKLFNDIGATRKWNCENPEQFLESHGWTVIAKRSISVHHTCFCCRMRT